MKDRCIRPHFSLKQGSKEEEFAEAGILIESEGSIPVIQFCMSSPSIAVSCLTHFSLSSEVVPAFFLTYLTSFSILEKSYESEGEKAGCHGTLSIVR